MLVKILFGLSLAVVHQLCYCDQHTYGSSNPGDKSLYAKVLFNQTREESVVQPKNYTLIFKYMGSETSPDITYAFFDVQNAVNTSFATIEVNSEKNKEKNLQAMLNIVNAENITVTCKIYGPNVNIMTGGDLNLYAKSSQRSNPKTMTVIYGHNSTQTRNRHVIMGRRQKGDKLIQFESKNVTFMYRFAEAEFNYHNEKQSITAVAFSFDSPTAIAFLNSTFLSEHKIDAIVYDLNIPVFEANMSVYGYDHFDKPSTYKPIVVSQLSKAYRAKKLSKGN